MSGNWKLRLWSVLYPRNGPSKGYVVRVVALP